MTSTRSAISMTRSMLCSTTMTVIPRCCSRRMRSISRSTSAPLSPAAGSSTLSRRGEARRARGKLEHALLAIGERSRGQIRSLLEPDKGQKPQCLLAAACTVALEGSGVNNILPRGYIVTGVKRGDDVIEHGHAAEQPDLLERAGKPETRAPMRGKPDQLYTIQTHLAGIGLIQPAQQVEQRRLSGPVRPDDRKHLAGPDSE